MSTRARSPFPHLQRHFRQARQEPQLALHRHRRHRGHEDARRPIGRSLPLSPQGPSLRKRPWLITVNEIFGGRLTLEELVLAGLKSEERVSGYHADNVALAIMEGFILIRKYESLELMRLNFPVEKDGERGV